MGKVKALLIGISKYSKNIADDLPLCKNDLSLMNESLKVGLGIKSSDIITLGRDGIVSEKDFISNLNKLNISISNHDVAIVYFSGHAQILENSHYICLSNSILGTDQFVKYISSIDCQIKVIIMDTCYCMVKKSCNYIFQSLDSIYENIGKGTVIITSSTPEQKSYFVPEASVSTFTYFLSTALTNNFRIRNGKKSLFDILYSAIMYEDFYNKRNAHSLQSPQICSNILGDVLFEVKTGHAYKEVFPGKIFKNHIIYSIEGRHNFNAKRYCIKTILKKPASYDEIIAISKQIAKKFRKLNIYENDIQRNKWNYKNTDVFFIYFYLNKEDAKNCHHICQTTWFNNSQDLLEYVKFHNICKQEDNLCFQTNKDYKLFKQLHITNITPYEDYEKFVKASLLHLINIGEDIVKYFTELMNKSISVEQYLEFLSLHHNKVNDFYLRNSDINPPDELCEIDTLYNELLSALYDIICIQTIAETDDIIVLSKNLIEKYKSSLNRITSLLCY